MIEFNMTWNLGVIALTLSAFTVLKMLRQPQFHRGYVIITIWLFVLLAPFTSHMLDLINNHGPHFMAPWLNPALNLLHGPIMLIYTQQLISKECWPSYKYALHMIPFLLFYALFTLYQPDAVILPGSSSSLLDKLNFISATPNVIEGMLAFFGQCNLIIFMIYSAWTIRILRQHNRNLSTYFSQQESTISLIWIYVIPSLFAFLVLLNTINESGDTSLLAPMDAHLLSYLTFIIVLCVFGVEQSPLHQTLGWERQDETQTSSRSENINAQTFAPEDLQKLNTLMATEKLYLNPDLTIYQLSHSLGMPRREVSSLLNNGLNKNFFQFINEWRVDEVKRQLQDPHTRQFTLLDIALNCGFKSKSSFNSIFKQCTGMTPSAYRKKTDDFD